MRATGRAVLVLWGEGRIVVRAWARFCAGVGSVERVEKVSACLEKCQSIGHRGKYNRGCLVHTQCLSSELSMLAMK